MFKKFFACIVFLLVIVSSACAEVEFWHDNYSLATLKDGKVDWSDARFGYSGVAVGNTGLTLTKENMNLTGSITFSGGNYSFWDGQVLQKVSGTPQTFRLAIPDWQTEGEEAEFDIFTETGYEFRIDSDSGLNGVNVSWNFPDMPSLNGSTTVPHYLTTQEQLEKHVVYFEFIRSGENVTGINWRIVKASDPSTPVILDYPVNFLRIRIWNFDQERICNLKPGFHIEPGETPEGTLMFDEPVKESDIWRVMTKFYTFDEDIDKEYDWYYYTSAEPKMYLWSHHVSDASLVNGKSSYNNAKFSDIFFDVETENPTIAESRYFTDEGSITIPGGGYTLKYSDNGETISKVANGADRTFALKMYHGVSVGDSYMEYEAVDDERNYLEFGGNAESSLPGKTFTWTFPAELNMNGSATIPSYKTTAEQLVSGVPYVELVSEDGYITAVNYKIVISSDTLTAITPSYRTDFNFRIYRTEKKLDTANSYNIGNASNKSSGTITLDVPQPLSTMKRLRVRLTSYEDADNPRVYQWNFYPASEDIKIDDPSRDIPVPPEPASPDIPRPGSSSGGCNAGFAIAGLALTAILIRKH